MLSQFYGVFLGFHLGWETSWIVQVKFPLFPRDNCMSSPDSLFTIRRNRDYVAMMYDLFHREESEIATLRPLQNLNLICVNVRRNATHPCSGQWKNYRMTVVLTGAYKMLEGSYLAVPGQAVKSGRRPATREEIEQKRWMNCRESTMKPTTRKSQKRFYRLAPAQRIGSLMNGSQTSRLPYSFLNRTLQLSQRKG
jgi:hypothetical protein